MANLQVFLLEMLAGDPFELADHVCGSPPERLVDRDDYPVGIVVNIPRQDASDQTGIRY